MKSRIPLYPVSASEARSRNVLSQWRESHRENIACGEAIQDAIRSHFDGMHLDTSCLDVVIDAYGWQRTIYVLSNTLQLKSHDGRFHEDNLLWSRLTHIPPDEHHNYEFAVDSHPAVLDGFVTAFRKRLDALALFRPEHCEPNARAELDYTGRVLVLSPDVLSEDYWEPKYQLWYALDGFGCSPTAIGRSVRAVCLADGETARWNRSEFLGPVRDEFLPDWAREQAEKLRAGEEISPVQAEETGQEMTL